MSATGSRLTQAIDVGGERFLLSTEKSIDLAYKGLREFNRIFEPISVSTKLSLDQIKTLLRTYLPYSTKDQGPFVFPSGSKDKEYLLRILDARLDQIKETRIHTLANDNLVRIQKRLLDLITQIESGSRTGQLVKKRKPLTENEIFSLILEFSWYLMHPNMEMNTDWEAMMKKMNTKSLESLAREIEANEEKQGSTVHATALNYFQNIDIKDVIRQPSKELAMKRIKNMVLFPGSETGKELKSRLKSLMSILTMKGFIEEPLEYRNSIPVIKNADLYEAKFQMPHKLIKGGDAAASIAEQEKKEDIALSLGKAMTPFFDYFKEMYDPIYGFMEEAMIQFETENPTVSSQKLMHELLSLLYLCTHLPSSIEGSVPKGVYRVNHVDSTALTFLSFMLKYTDAKKIEGKSQEEKDAFLGQLFKLPIFRLSTYKGKTLTAPYTDPSSLPYVQFAMMNQNLSVKTDAEVEKQLAGVVKQIDAVQPFFQDHAVYLIVSDSNLTSNSLTPLTLFDINYKTIQLDKTKVDTQVVENIETKMSNGTQLMLEQAMNVKETTFNHGELIMCILQVLKKQMPQ